MPKDKNNAIWSNSTYIYIYDKNEPYEEGYEYKFTEYDGNENDGIVQTQKWIPAEKISDQGDEFYRIEMPGHGDDIYIDGVYGIQVRRKNVTGTESANYYYKLDTKAPKITNISWETTTNSITVKLEETDVSSGIKTNKIVLTKADGSAVETYEGAANTYTFNGLTPNEEYCLSKIEVKDNAENTYTISEDDYERLGIDNLNISTESEQPTQPEASISKNGITSNYAELEDAIGKATSGDVIKLETDITRGETINVEPGSPITLDLNGKKIEIEYSTSIPALKIQNTITITDSSSDKSGIIKGGYGVEVNRGTLTLENGTIEGVSNDGVTLTSDPIDGPSGKIVVNNGKIIGTVYGIKGVSTDEETGNSEAEIYGGTIEGKGDVALYFEGTNSGVELDTKVSVYGGKIIGGIYNGENSILTLGDNEDSEVSITEPEITSENIGIENNGTFNFYDGIIHGKTGAIEGEVSETPNGYEISESTTVKQGYNTAKLVKSNIAVTGVRLNKQSITLKVRETEQLVATVNPTSATNKAVTWSSDTTSVATVDTTGKVTAISAGTATITVKTVDGNKTATCSVTVTEEEVPPEEYKDLEDIELNKNNLSLKVGQTDTSLQVTFTPSDADIDTVTWKSNKESVATIDKNGKITAVGEGTATITVTVTDKNGNTKTATISVKVEKQNSSDDPSGDNPSGENNNGGNSGGQTNGGSSNGGSNGGSTLGDVLGSGTKNDPTLAGKVIPKTGFTYILLIAAGIIAVGGTFAYIRYRKMKF